LTASYFTTAQSFLFGGRTIRSRDGTRCPAVLWKPGRPSGRYAAGNRSQAVGWRQDFMRAGEKVNSAVIEDFFRCFAKEFSASRQGYRGCRIRGRGSSLGMKYVQPDDNSKTVSEHCFLLDSITLFYDELFIIAFFHCQPRWRCNDLRLDGFERSVDHLPFRSKRIIAILSCS